MSVAVGEPEIAPDTTDTILAAAIDRAKIAQVAGNDGLLDAKLAAAAGDLNPFAMHGPRRR